MQIFASSAVCIVIHLLTFIFAYCVPALNIWVCRTLERVDGEWNALVMRNVLQENAECSSVFQILFSALWQCAVVYTQRSGASH